jgi:hypothetical protein
MAIDRTGINSLDAGAPNLRLMGDIQLAQSIPIELQQRILQYWIQQGDGSSADRIEDVPEEFIKEILPLLLSEAPAQGGMESMSAAQGGRAGYRGGQLVKPGPGRPGYGGEWDEWDMSGVGEDVQAPPDSGGWHDDIGSVGETSYDESAEWDYTGVGEDPIQTISVSEATPIFEPKPLGRQDPMGGREDYTAQQIREADPYAYTTSGNTITATELNIANNPQKYIDMGVDHSIVEEIKRKVDASTYVGGESGPIYGGEDKTVTLPVTGGGGGEGGVQFTDGTGPLATTAATTPATTTTPAGDYTPATMPFGDYYVGGAPTTAQEAFMQASGAVPEAVGRDVWARGGRIGYGLGGLGDWITDIFRKKGRAEVSGLRKFRDKDEDEDEEYYPWNMARGGRVPAAYGGVMGRDGRRAYGLGSLNPFKAVKKLLKSKVGKAALMVGLGIYGPKMFGADMPLGGKGGWGQAWEKFAPKLAAINPFKTVDEGAKVEKLANKLMGLGMEKTAATNKAIDMVIKGGASTVPGWATAASIGAMGLPYLFPNLGKPDEDDDAEQQRLADLAKWRNQFAGLGESFRPVGAQGGRIGAQEGGLMNLGGMEKDYRQEGGFVPIGGQEKADDVPARLSKNEFVFTADAVRAAGGGDIDAGAEIMENVMENLEQGGQVSEESQGLEGARDMFATSQRLEGVM